jgi:hypothetical protein
MFAVSIRSKHGGEDEAEQILELIREYRLQSLLQPGTITWEHQTRDQCFTVDVILATAMLAGSITRCRIYLVDQESDHTAVDIGIDLAPKRYPQRMGRRMYKNAD